MKSVTAAAVTAIVVLGLTACGPPPVDEFKVACDAAHGELLESSQTKTATGVGIPSGGGSPVITTTSVTFTLRLCLAEDGTIIDAVLE